MEVKSQVTWQCMSSNILQISAVGETTSAPTRHAEQSCRLHDRIQRAWTYAAGIWRSWQGNILPASSPGIQTQQQHIQTQGVFDVSKESTNGHSLNNILLIGPTVQQDLFSIMIPYSPDCLHSKH